VAAGAEAAAAPPPVRERRVIGVHEPATGARGDHDVLTRFDLSGRVALVTGGTRGLGLAISRAFSAAGADVMVASRKEDACRDIAAELRAAGGRAVGHACHVGRWNDLERLVEAAYDEFGRVDVLVNNAGVSPRYPTLGEVSEELFDKVIAVNLKGPFRLSALVGERMAAGDGGSIINISSTGAVRPTGDIVPYAAAKAGLNALTVGYADALGPKVRVNAIMPGPFLTTISQAWDMDMLAERTRTFPLRRAGFADEIAGAALYLAGDASSYTTGSILTVDGGARWSMPGGGDAS
jgi:NAD(P)-dependent dehydrogenase (short-subunit alcohol dehydrogenase family)